jgi:metallo-beta-lactamase class B
MTSFRLHLPVAVLAALVAVAPAGSQDAQARRQWNQPIEPFKVIGNVYYVGAAGVSAFLVATPDGSILLDGGLPETALQIAANIITLGFRVADVKFLLNSHAHFDHAGGLAELKKLSGGLVLASAADAPALRTGRPDMPAVDVDRVLADGDSVRLGGTTLTAVLTPGHTKGCTTWTTTVTEDAKPYRVLFHCSTSVVDRLVGNDAYPGIAADYAHTFAKLRRMTADVFLAPHPSFFDLAGKLRRRGAGGPNPFVDSSELAAYVERSDREFHAELARQRKAAGR